MLFHVGSRVEGLRPLGDAAGRTAWYPGVVTAVHGDGTASVRFIGVPGGTGRDAVVSTAPGTLRPLVHPNPHLIPAEREVRIGARFLGKWAVDGQWYTARVDEVTGMDAVRVNFVEYGNTEIVPRDWLQREGGAGAGAAAAASSASAAAASAAAAAAASASAPSGRDGGGGGGGDEDSDDGDEDGAGGRSGNSNSSLYADLVVPDNLKPLPTDTEADRLRKRKKLKAVKAAWRQKKLEEASQAKANSWQSFLGQKRGLGGGGGAGRGEGGGGGGGGALGKRPR
jgi:hypothetical protein